MDIARVLKYCQNSIEAEKKKTPPSLDTIKSLEGVISFIKNADTPQEKERIEIREIFNRHHKDFKKTNYVFTTKQDPEIDGIIIQIKEEMMENMEQYDGMTIGQFFDLFMTHIDDASSNNFWRVNQFTTWGINKQFRKILSQVLSSVNNNDTSNKSGSKQKPSYSSVMNH